MEILENVPLGPKTTMKIGGCARYFAVLQTKQHVEEACTFAQNHQIPLIVLGGGSNTIFSDGTIRALVVQIGAQTIDVRRDGTVKVEAGANLAHVLTTLATHNLDLSLLAGIPGTVGGAIFGNAGQGPKGVWIDTFIESVEVCTDGRWEILKKSECGFGYRESGFKRGQKGRRAEGQKGQEGLSPIIWSVLLKVPKRPHSEIEAAIKLSLEKRHTSQPFARTAGSIFKAASGTPAWQLIDAAGLRSLKVGDIELHPMHANFLQNTGHGTFGDAVRVIETIRSSIPEPLDVEMRMFAENGAILL